MAKAKTIYSCQKCGSQFPKWAGQCTECGAWNRIMEEQPATTTPLIGTPSPITTLNSIKAETETRFSTNITELNRVLGGGLVAGSVVLVGGDPGIGKSTLLLQTIANLALEYSALYITGEESLQQIALRAQRLGLAENKLKLLAETNIENIIASTTVQQPAVMVIDSIQTIYTDKLQSTPGSVSQLRESTAQLSSICQTY